MASGRLGLSDEAFAGLLLATGALLGLLFENLDAMRPFYDSLLNLTTTVAVGEAKISKPLLLWINDGLMAIFFLYVALEIKREVVAGSLSSWSQAALPVYGALGGIVVPAALFLAIVGIGTVEAQGWAIPAATDIAFAVGVLAAFGNRVPPLLKTFLLALAVVDDLAAIVIIALFYTTSLSLAALVVAALCLAALLALNRGGVRGATPFVLIGLVLWAAVLKSGVHATLAGVALGFAIPLAPGPRGNSLARRFEHGLHPWVSYMILPVFAFANSGVSLEGLSWEALTQPLTLGVALGLFVGKQAGVFGAVALSVRLGLARRGDGLTWGRIYGAACLAGIGFTMSLFIGGLAFGSPDFQNMVRIGVMAGSIASALLGVVVLAVALRRSAPMEFRTAA